MEIQMKWFELNYYYFNNAHNYVTSISFPCLTFIWPNNENFINIHIVYVKNIHKMNKKQWF
jgi:hypothetical protein